MAGKKGPASRLRSGAERARKSAGRSLWLSDCGVLPGFGFRGTVGLAFDLEDDDPEAQARIQACVDGPITRHNTERMQEVARAVLAGLPEPRQDETAEA